MGGGGGECWAFPGELWSSSSPGGVRMPWRGHMGIVLHQVGASGQRAGRGWKGGLPAEGRGSSTFWLCRNVSSPLAGKGRRLFWCFQCSRRMMKWGMSDSPVLWVLASVLRGCMVWWGGAFSWCVCEKFTCWSVCCCCFGLWLWGWGSKLRASSDVPGVLCSPVCAS